MRTPAAFSTAGLGLLLCAPAASAADGERTPLDLADPAAESAQAAGGSGGGLVRTIVGLAIVLAVIYGLHWVLKQVRAAREERATGRGLAPLATLPLGAKSALHLVRAGTDVLLVGVADGAVTPIRSYPEAEARVLGLLPEPDEDEAAAAEAAAAAALPRLLESLRSRTVIR